MKTSSTRRQFVAGASSIALAAALPIRAAEAAWPTKPITLVVPFAAGGSLDVTARVIAERLREQLGQQVLVSNRPGAGSALGARVVATSPADGYTLLFASGSAFGFLHLLVKGFDIGLANFDPIASVATNSSLIAVSSKTEPKSLKELVAQVRAKPGSVNFCSTGTSGLNHLQLEMFRRQVKAQGAPFEVTHVPYNGVAPALSALRAGDVQACNLPYSSLIKNLNGHEIRVLAVQRHKRLPSMPDVPTTGEQGYPGMDDNDALVNISAPRGTPATVLRKLEDSLHAVMIDPAVKRRLEELDVQPTWLGAQDTSQWLAEDVRKFSDIIKEAGIAAE